MRQISLHRLIGFLHFPALQTPASICEKSSHCLRKFEGLRCGARDAIIEIVRPGGAATVAAMRDSMLLAVR
jgi:hypothetical protein